LHRGPHPDDHRRFGPEALPRLRTAVDELAWMLGRGYAEPSALKLVGDRHGLDARQRLAVMRATCTDAARASRAARRASPEAIRNATLRIDGFNAITTLEAALGGGVVLSCRDGAFRDLAGVHGTYRRVEETRPALALLGEAIAALDPAAVVWHLDRPVSNSGRLAGMLRESAKAHGWPWSVELEFNPDATLAASSDVVATSDAAILDRAAHWLGLARLVVESLVPMAWVVRIVVAERA
jgi:hypothetical protein